MLPDLNNVPQQRQAVGAIVASLVLHLILMLFFVALAGMIPDVHVDFAKPEAQLQPLEVTIMDTFRPEEKPAPAVDEKPAELVSAEELKARAMRPVIDSAGLAQSDGKPKDALFESDQDMKAGSEKPATGDAPLPSQDGRTDTFMTFKDQRSRLGVPNPSPTVEEAPAPSAPPAEAAPPVTPKVVVDKPAGEPTAPEQKVKPPPAPEVLEPASDQIAVATKMSEVRDGPVTELTPPPAPAFRTRVTPVQPARETTEMAKLITPAPKSAKKSQPSEPEYQEDLYKSRIDGGITTRGPNGVDAIRTPLGVYQKQVKSAIGSRWTYYVKTHPDRFAVGSVKIAYAITREGKIRDIRVISNTSNASFEMMCQQVMNEARIMPPPEDALPDMSDGKLEDTFTFTILPPL